MEDVINTIRETLAELVQNPQDLPHEIRFAETLIKAIIDQDEYLIFNGILILIDQVMWQPVIPEPIKDKTKLVITLLKGFMMDEAKIRVTNDLLNLILRTDINMETGETSRTSRNERRREIDEREYDRIIEEISVIESNWEDIDIDMDIEEEENENPIKRIIKKYNIKLEPKIFGSGAPAA